MILKVTIIKNNQRKERIKLISVITSTYNKAKYLDLTLAGYQMQNYKNFELVIVDDGSNDNTEYMIEKYKSVLNIKYYKQKNLGAATARNRALQLAEGNYIIIVDDDRIPCPDFVLEHKKVLDARGQVVSIGKQGLIISQFIPELNLKFKDGFNLYNKYPELLSSNNKQLFEADDIINNFDQVIDKYYLSDYNEESLAEMVEKFGDNLEKFYMAWSKAYGGNMAFDRRFCKQELKYDNNYKGYGCEDIDFSYQLYLQDYHFSFSRNAINYHQEHKRGVNEARDSYKNFQYFYNKYSHLEVLLMKMDFDGVISLGEANSFLNMIYSHYENLDLPIKDYVKRKVKYKNAN